MCMHLVLHVPARYSCIYVASVADHDHEQDHSSTGLYRNIDYDNS